MATKHHIHHSMAHWTQEDSSSSLAEAADSLKTCTLCSEALGGDIQQTLQQINQGYIDGDRGELWLTVQF